MTTIIGLFTHTVHILYVGKEGIWYQHQAKNLILAHRRTGMLQKYRYTLKISVYRLTHIH